MRAADLYAWCLENEGVEYVFGLPGEETIQLVDPIASSSLRSVTTRRELPAEIDRFTGDGGFMLDSQELETAVRLGLDFVVLIWNDSSYGLIEWKQVCRLGWTNCAGFDNPDFVLYARSLGAEGYRVERASDLLPTLRAAIGSRGVAVIDCPVDYRENMFLTERLGEPVCAD